MSDVSSPATLLPIDEALAIVAAQITPLEPEPVRLEHAHGRFLAEDLEAAIDLPPFANSAMDGYALRAADTPGTLRLIGESAAGSPYAGRELAAGEAVAISTGAVLPGAADAIAPIEDVSAAGAEIVIAAPVERGAHIRAAGSDIVRGDPLLSAGTRIGPAQIGAAAAVGLRELPCRRLPRVAILTTGTELRPPGEELGPGQIYDANGPMLGAALRTAGGVVELIPAAADTPAAHREALEHALEHDVVISSGGVSVGPHDLVRGIGRELGVNELFWRIALRPGKPLTFGVRGRTLLFGLPGNPVSTLVCFELFVRPALLSLQGAPEFRPAFGAGVLGSAVQRNPERDDLIRVQVAWTSRPGMGRGNAVLLPLAGQQSHQIAVTARADGLARIPAGTGELPAGTEVSYLPLH
jgi:molybdopterin molybdotransferase